MKQKYVVIGGGIAGLTVGAFLERKGMEVVICEKQPRVSGQGHAFLLHADALSILREFDARGGIKLPGENIDLFILKHPNGNEIRTETLRGWTCMKRVDLLDFLDHLLDPATIVRGRTFSHFIRREGKVVAAAFSNGEVESGDIFIGTDGGNSKVRDELFGTMPVTSSPVKEVVGITRDRKTRERYGRTFVKFQHDQYGLSFGMIPTGLNEFVWFMQYDTCRGDVSGHQPDTIRTFCTGMLKDFPAEVGEILRSNDFSKTYIWKTRDFDLLPSFHQENIVLLGDAAHLALPFSSAGTTNAIIGAKTLYDCLETSGALDPVIPADASDLLESAFQQYYDLRADTVNGHIRMGRELRKAFLHPKKDEVRVPLLSPLGQKLSTPARTPAPRPRNLHVRYFTDPICSTCWIIQPVLKKMSLEYGPYLEMEYYMGGLLPSWDTCEGKIKSPSDAARLWKDVDGIYNMPIDGDIWLEDPLYSSFPPSIAFKAAQLQDPKKALLYLRRIREMLFLEKKNIVRWQYLELAAGEIGLDIGLFKKNYEGNARTAFQHDLQLARDMHVKSFPTLIFSNGGGKTIRLKGNLGYHDVEEVILELHPTARKRTIDPGPENLFRFFPTMLEEEFAVLSDLVQEDARKLLHQLIKSGHIRKMPTEKGVLYTSNRFND